MARVPERYRPFLVRHRKLVKFLLVGGTCFVLTTVVDLGLKFTVLQHKPVVALTVATVIATVVSYVLNRQWSFRANGSSARRSSSSWSARSRWSSTTCR
ncbi:GtrA family protein [Kitasatospora arboriphila]